MALSYAGIDLVLEDPGGEVTSFIEHYLPLENTPFFGCEPPAVYSGRYDMVGLPNYPPLPQLLLNTLYVPTGAVRWSVGLFLATTAQKNAAIALAGTAGATLAMSAPHENAMLSKQGGGIFFADEISGGGYAVDDSAGFIDTLGEVAAHMYLLPPRPVADSSSGLWILPLVDQRYYWQFRSVDEIDDNTFDSLSILQFLGQKLGATLYSRSLVSGGPVATSNFDARHYQNAAVLLEAASRAMSARVTWAWWTGKNIYNLVTPSESQFLSGDRAFGSDESPDGIATTFPRTAGGQATWKSSSSTLRDGNLAAITPASVAVVFQKKVGAYTQEGEIYAVTKAASGYTSNGSVAGTKHVIFALSYTADFANDAASTPDNASALDSIADNLATAYYRGIALNEDITYAGIFPLRQHYGDDCVEYVHGQLRSDGTYAVMTRVRTLGHNVTESDLFGVPAAAEHETDAFWAKITDRVGDEYTWIEQDGPDGGDLTDGRTGTADGDDPGREINGSQANFDVPENLIVRMWKVGDGAAAKYWFDRGLTNGETNPHQIEQGGDEWLINDSPVGTAGVSISDILTLTGDTLDAIFDSHGQLTHLTRDAPEDDPSCSGGPFSGTFTIVSDFTIDSITINPNCSVTVNSTKTRYEVCVANGIIQSVTAVS